MSRWARISWRPLDSAMASRWSGARWCRALSTAESWSRSPPALRLIPGRTGWSPRSKVKRKRKRRYSSPGLMKNLRPGVSGEICQRRSGSVPAMQRARLTVGGLGKLPRQRQKRGQPGGGGRLPGVPGDSSARRAGWLRFPSRFRWRNGRLPNDRKSCKDPTFQAANTSQ
ncbi:hypothetical protein electrica_02199 [Klebsiella electrica]|nr:hypothetical protein electrica_02199 [Klebsiella electrica]